MFALTYARRLALSGLLALGLSSSAFATTYYVTQTGNDGNTGTSIANAWRTLNRASGIVNPGDTVYALDGDFSEPYGYTALYLNRAGTAKHWIRFKAYPGTHPIIHNTYWDGVLLGAQAAYIEIDGFTVLGPNASLTLAGAQSQTGIANPLYDGNCMAVDGSGGTATQRPHHIRFIHNVVGECGGGGIAVQFADYVTISENTVYNNGWYGIYGNSGISVLGSWNSDTYTGEKILITSNRVFGNFNYIPYVYAGRITDGEGIILDTNNNSLGNTGLPPYAGRILVANNISYNNGSSGLLVFETDHADIINNTTYNNVLSPVLSGGGELDLYGATDTNVINNILYAGDGQNPLQNVSWAACADCTVDYNIYYNGSNTGAPIGGPDDIVANPQFVNPEAANPFDANFKIKRTSPAVDAGESWIDHYFDHDIVKRPLLNGWDIGAYEYNPDCPE
jgi:hypothetical protein